LDEALRIRVQEQLPTYERLGDVREIAITRGKIADILESRGELDEALHIRQKDQLPVLERLGDVREIAITKGQIADILVRRGELDEALRIQIEECLPLAERLGDAVILAHIKFNIAQIRLAKGIKRSEDLQEVVDDLLASLSANLKLKRPEGVAVVGSSLGQVLLQLGQSEVAHQILKLAQDAYRKIGRHTSADHIAALLEEPS
jgi:hypothetical protein